MITDFNYVLLQPCGKWNNTQPPRYQYPNPQNC